MGGENFKETIMRGLYLFFVASFGSAYACLWKRQTLFQGQLPFRAHIGSLPDSCEAFSPEYFVAVP